mgnify:CR=1 FL=1
MVEISGGSFTMGSPPTERERKKLEGSRENVNVTSFAIGETEVELILETAGAEHIRCIYDTLRTDKFKITEGR